MPESKPYTGYLIPHTHWDREWYQPFQVFRARLVDVIDSTLDILCTDSDYRRFTLDGQAIVLDDYLAVRPEREADIRQHVQSGRLRIGPWYVLADEFLVSPEALVRNLMLGRQVSERFGVPMTVAYTPDSFGHISQLPLITSGFGLDSIVFERGVGDEGERLRGEFHWLAADGQTGVFAAHLLGTYSAAAALGHKDWELRDPYSAERAVQQMRVVLYGANNDPPELPQWLHESFERTIGGVTAYSTNGALVLLNGSDHLFPQRNIPEMIADLNRAFPDVHFVHSDVEEFVAAARRPLAELETHQGEFRGSRYQHVLSGVLSARMYLKGANHHAETLLERYAEPLAALATLTGAAYPQPLIRQAWRLLLENHPHDSICGCSVDPVHREMMPRFAGVMQLGNDLCRRAFESLSGIPGTDYLTVFNPLPQARETVVEAEVEVPAGEGQRLRLLDAAQKPVLMQMRVHETFAAGRSDKRVDRVKLKFLAPLPALGLASYKLELGAVHELKSPLETSREGDSIRLENAALRVMVAADGAVTLFDKTSGLEYPLRLCFESSADAGDEYDYSPIQGDEALFLSQSTQAPELLEAGAVAATVRLNYLFTLPERLSDDRQQRVGSVQVHLTLHLTLEAAGENLRIAVACENHAQDHRLRLRVASSCHASHVWADGHFDVLRRPLRPEGGEAWFQKPQGTSHQRRFVAVQSDTQGLALLNKGLPEYEAIETDKGVDLAVTLLRSVGWLSRDDLLSRPQGAGPALATPEAQCLGQHRFELALYPYAGAWWESALPQAAEAFIAPPKAVLASQVAAFESLLELSSPLTLSSLKGAEERESLIVRIWNPTPAPLTGRLVIHPPLREAYRVRLDETRTERLEATQTLLLTLPAKGVETLELVFDRKEGTL